jgi:hypothetical protein
VKTTLRIIIAIACGFGLAAASHAAAPADAPAGSTGLCKDGTYYDGATKKGACKGHKGVKEWWGGADSKSAKAAKEAPAAAETKAPAETKAAAETKTAAASTPKPAAVAAPGGGAGKVWVNTDSKVYHCQGDRWYGKTKQGEYMTEADATAKGYRANRGKACK